MTLPLEIIQDILLRLDLDTFTKFCNEDQTSICDPNDNYFWRQRTLIDHGPNVMKPDTWNWYDVWRSNRLVFKYNFVYQNPYIPEIDDIPYEEANESLRMTPSEILILINNFKEKLDSILEYYDIRFDQDRHEIIILTTDYIDANKEEEIDNALIYNVPSFREITNPPDFDFEEYISSFEDPVEGYTIHDLTPKSYSINIIDYNVNPTYR